MWPTPKTEWGELLAHANNARRNILTQILSPTGGRGSCECHKGAIFLSYNYRRRDIWGGKRTQNGSRVSQSLSLGAAPNKRWSFNENYYLYCIPRPPAAGPSSPWVADEMEGKKKARAKTKNISTLAVGPSGQTVGWTLPPCWAFLKTSNF